MALVSHYIGHVSKTYSNLATSACGRYSGELVQGQRTDIGIPNKRWVTFNRWITFKPETEKVCLLCLKISIDQKCLSPLHRNGMVI